MIHWWLFGDKNQSQQHRITIKQVGFN